jgi:phosphate transport system substrate-binding protein
LRVSGPSQLAELSARWFSEYGETATWTSIPDQDAVAAVVRGEQDLALVASAPDRHDVLVVPVAVTASAIAYNILVMGDLRLTPETLRNIFAGSIKRWRDPDIARANPGVTLPDLPIQIFVPPDAEASARALREYAGIRGQISGTKVASDEEALIAVERTEGGITCVERARARRRSAYPAALRNPDGAFVTPITRSVSRAAVGVRLPADLRASIVNARGVDSYPMSVLTYAVVSSNSTPDRARQFLRWAIRQGQPFLTPLGLAPLPGLMVLLIDPKLAAR